MSEIRLNWIKQRVYDILNIADDAVFIEFLERNDGKFKDELVRYLSQTQEDSDVAMLFYSVRRQEEERVEVEITESEPEPEEPGPGESVPQTSSELSASIPSAEPSETSVASSALSDLKGKKAKAVRKPKAAAGKKKSDDEAKRAAEEAAAKAAAEAELKQQDEEETAGPRTRIVIQKVLFPFLYHALIVAEKMIS